MNITIKPLTIKDYDDIVSMLQEISEYIPLEKNKKENFKTFINQKNQASVAIYDNELIIGFGTVLYEYKIRGGKVAHIEDIVIRKSHQRKGLGKKLIENLILLSRKNKCYKVTLSCLEKNIAFYESCGFSINGNNMSLLLK